MRPETQFVTRLDCCQYLLVSQINCTLTNFAEHSEKFSHDALNRNLAGERLTPSVTWENVKGQAAQSQKGFLVFDDTVADKDYSHAIELVRRQCSGNAHGVIKGVGIVTCVCVNPELDQFWILDCRIFSPESDGKTKLGHVQDMLFSCVHQKQLQFSAVLMDCWHATRNIMLSIDKYGKIFFCPLKCNRHVDDSGGSLPYRHVDSPDWTEAEEQQGKTVEIRDFPANYKVKLFRVELSAKRTEHVVTNDMTQDNTQAVQKVCALRWKVEQASPGN